MPVEHVVVTSTTDTEAAARTLAAGVIHARLGACAQVIGPITSVFRWQGEVTTEPEWRVEIKTSAGQADALCDHIAANHGYDMPEVVVTPVVGGNADYLTWVAEETAAAP